MADADTPGQPTVASLPLLVVLLLIALASPGCGDTAPVAAPASTGPTATDTVTSTATVTATGTVEPSGPATEPGPTGTDLAQSTEARAAGSGCTPGSDDSLPDGRWYGLVDRADDRQLGFDLACWFSGEDAIRAAEEDGAESPPPNDYHVRNERDLLRTLAVDPEAPVVWYPDGGDPDDVTTAPYREWRSDREDRAFQLAVWLTVQGGRVVGVDEQWVP